MYMLHKRVLLNARAFVDFIIFLIFRNYKDIEQCPVIYTNENAELSQDFLLRQR